MHILVLEKDLFFAVKIRDTLRHHDIEARTVRNLAAFEQGLVNNEGERPGLVIVDLGSQGVDWEAAIRRARELDYPVLAFGPHMDLAAHARARQAGAHRVLANSRFAADMPGVVTRMLANPADTSIERDTDEVKE